MALIYFVILLIFLIFLIFPFSFESFLYYLNLSNNYFHYDEVTIEKLEFISDAKSVGFTIKEIGQIIDAWYNRKYTKKQKLEILDDKLISLEQKMKEIKEMKKQIFQFKDDVLNNRC